MRVSVLGSGSKGNAILVEAGPTRILVDAGFSGVDLARRLAAVGVEPEELEAMVITHDHGDHTRGIGIFARRHGTPIHATQGTLQACAKLLRGEETVRPYQAGRPFSIGRVRIEPFLTVHDAADPVAIAVVDRETEARVGIATDLGRPNAQVRHALRECDVLVLEANHDDVMLRAGPYPPRVRSRIASSHGHLSNHEAARLAVELMTPRLTGIVLAHLSAECNKPELAAEIVGAALRKAGWKGYLTVAPQDEPTDFLDIEELRVRSGPEQLRLI